ncbi:MAG: VanZ family protein [Verrucomicrobiota bacterium]
MMRLPGFSGNSRFWWAGYAAWLVLLSILSSITGPEPGTMPRIPGLDKVAHLVYFAGGACALHIAFRLSFARFRHPGPGLAIIVVTTTAIFGALDEWHQSFTPSRAGLDVWDWTADVAGAFVALWLAPRIFDLLPRKEEFPANAAPAS